jgi:hypothetical protein
MSCGRRGHRTRTRTRRTHCTRRYRAPVWRVPRPERRRRDNGPGCGVSGCHVGYTAFQAHPNPHRSIAHDAARVGS